MQLILCLLSNFGNKHQISCILLVFSLHRMYKRNIDGLSHNRGCHRIAMNITHLSACVSLALVMQHVMLMLSITGVLISP